MDIRVKIGLRIRELRKGLQLTQQSLAFKSELDKTYVNEVENGKRNVSVINLEKLVIALEVDLKTFFNVPSFENTIPSNKGK